MQNHLKDTGPLKIVVLDGFTLNPGDLSWDGLNALGEVTLYDRTPVDQVIARATGHQIVLTNKTPLSRDTIRSLPSVKYIGVLATGYNVVDTEAAGGMGIVVTNIPAYSTRSVAQMVFAHLLEICHHVGAHDTAVKRGDWSGGVDFCFWNYPLVELEGKTMGIIGMGRIGQAVAGIARAMGMNIIATTPHPKAEMADGNFQYAGLDELLEKSDVISLHCPVTDATKGIINRQSIAGMKDGVILINTSRGQLIVEEDLAEALKSGKIAAAGLDVMQMEPPPAGNPLLSLPNCIITPHIAWAPREARIRLMKLTVENLRSYLAGKPVNVVSPIQTA
jgi:glycerate dehydrogenase